MKLCSTKAEEELLRKMAGKGLPISEIMLSMLQVVRWRWILLKLCSTREGIK